MCVTVLVISPSVTRDFISSPTFTLFTLFMAALLDKVML
ncbi:hypothetical protein MGSAQ_001959 [marine sediment metagenome]|uniref:Uncharacterized protein n=1 Tax=marine sediment metagenome TaxID=412755 RepID=A0A1B6NSV5_9ZZZZ